MFSIALIMFVLVFGVAADVGALLSMTKDIVPVQKWNWNAATPPCEWHGVECDASGVVWKIDWSGHQLGGTMRLSTFPAGLTHLNLCCNAVYGVLNGTDLPRALTFLNLAGTLFTGTVDGKDLPRGLLHLDLNWSKLNGTFKGTLPPRLTYVDISVNPNFVGTILGDELPHNLTHLLLTGLDTFIGRIDGQDIPRSLVSLDLGSCSIFGIINGVDLPPRLQELRASYTKINGTINGQDLPRTLTVLDIGASMFNGTINGKDIPLGLTNLHLYNTKLNGTINGVDLPRGLTYLDLGRTAFQGTINGEDIRPLALTSLILDHSSVVGIINGQDLPRQLTVIMTGGTKLEGTINGENLPPGLTDLKLGPSKFKGTINAAQLPVSLTLLDLSMCQFEGKMDGILPSNLVKFNIAGNNWSGSFDMTKLPPSLSEFNISRNRFEGPLDLTRLPLAWMPITRESVAFHLIFDISQNNFTGRLDLSKTPRAVQAARFLLDGNSFCGNLSNGKGGVSPRYLKDIKLCVGLAVPEWKSGKIETCSCPACPPTLVAMATSPGRLVARVVTITIATRPFHLTDNVTLVVTPTVTGPEELASVSVVPSSVVFRKTDECLINCSQTVLITTTGTAYAATLSLSLSGEAAAQYVAQDNMTLFEDINIVSNVTDTPNATELVVINASVTAVPRNSSSNVARSVSTAAAAIGSTAEGTAIVTAMMSLILGDGAGKAGCVPILVEALTCSSEIQLELTRSMHPTQVSVGSANSALFDGAVIVNTAISVAVVLIHFVAVRVHGKPDSATKLQFPSRTSSAPEYFQPGVYASCLFVVINSDSVGSRVACGLLFMVLVCGDFWLTWHTMCTVNDEAVFQDGKWKDAIGHKGFVKRMSSFFKKNKPTRLWYRWVESAAVVGLAACAAVVLCRT